jgi:hypothetical protein
VTRTLFVEALLVGALGGLPRLRREASALAALIQHRVGSTGFLPTDTALVVSPSVLVITPPP